MDAQLKRRLSHSVTHLLCLSEDGYGKKTFDAPAVRLCYLMGMMRMIRNLAGEEITTTYRCLFPGQFPLTVKDEFIVNGTIYPIAAYTQFDSPARDDGMTEVYL